MDMGRLKENESLFHSMSNPPVTLTWPFGVKSKHKPIFTNKRKKRAFTSYAIPFHSRIRKKEEMDLILFSCVCTMLGCHGRAILTPTPSIGNGFFVELRKTISVFPLSEWLLPPLGNGFCRSWGRLVQFFPLFEQFLPPYPFHMKWFSVGLRMISALNRDEFLSTKSYSRDPWHCTNVSFVQREYSAI